ncbi:MAG: T9SS type A sorting domain-containing protein [Bacteroidetes bacterium]|nr:T9SS type A sorting domain-containing protein [Bacteroidota bacterium]
MKNALSILLLLLGGQLFSQNLISSTLVLSKTKAQLNTQFGVPFIQYNVKLYKITYTTTDINGVLDTASGLIGVPSDPTRMFPRLVYQHGTSSAKTDVPSNTASNGEGTLGGLFAGMGYFTVMPDYLGLGSSRGFHPYVHAASEASAAIDMLHASAQFIAQLGNVYVNNQLFITGYSQGGHAAMALHRALELNPDSPYEVTAAAHLSGPYSISGVMRDLILSDAVYTSPSYLPNTILSYQTVYKNIFTNLSDIFKPNYATLIAPFYAGTKSLSTLNNQLLAQLKSDFGNYIPGKMLKDSVVQVVKTDLNHPFNQNLRDNDVYKWAPQAPTRLFYCKADDQVPYLNSIVARDTITALNPPNFLAVDVDSTKNHVDCVTPAIIQTLLFFAGFQTISTATQDLDNPFVLDIYPNPAAESLHINALPTDGQIDIYDIWGQNFGSFPVSASGASVSLASVPSGLYMVIYHGNGLVLQQKLVVGR